MSNRCVYDSVDHQVDDVALAPSFACARYANGEVWCAGPGKPARVTGIEGKVTEIAAAGTGACAIANRVPYCWQNGEAAKRISNVADARALAMTPKRTCATSWTSPFVSCWASDLVAHPLKGVETYSAIAIGSARSCAVSARNLICWTGDGPPSKVAEAEDVQQVAQTDHALCYIDRDHKVRCRGGAFGEKFVELVNLRGSVMLHTGSEIVCGMPAGEVHCNDGKEGYAVTLGDSGTHVKARALAANGKFTINVHADDDVVDADDDLPFKSVADQLGQFGPTDTMANIRAAKGVKPAPVMAAATTSVASCKEDVFGTCTEYPNGPMNDATTRCRNHTSVWSDSPCSRQNVLGTCLIGGTQLDTGATLVIYTSKTRSVGEAAALCTGGFEGTFTAASK